MKINVKKIIYDNFFGEDLEFFKEFNIYKIIDCKKYILTKKYINNRYFLYKERLKICSFENTTPNIIIKFCEIIDGVNSDLIEGKKLRSNKLVIIGEIKFSLIVFYSNNSNIINNISMPFSTFIVIPKNICNRDIINISYLIEDVSLVYLEDDKIMVSITPLLEYKDEYIK